MVHPNVHVDKVPGISFEQGKTLRKKGYTQASQLYDCFKGKSRNDFVIFLSSKFGICSLDIVNTSERELYR